MLRRKTVVPPSMVPEEDFHDAAVKDQHRGYL